VTYVRIAEAEDLWDGDLVGRHVDRTPVLLIKLDGAVYAYEDRCAHLGVPLSEGRLDGGVLTCPAHHYEYDARTGAGVRPVTVCLRAYPLRIEDGSVWVDVTCPTRSLR
jgi:toluene monooxygenase system ferredoxin subunit